MTLTLGAKLAPIHPETATATATKSRLSPCASGAHQAGSSRFRRPSTSPEDTQTTNYMAASSGRSERDVLLCMSVPVLESLVTGDCSQVRPMLGGLLSPIVCSIRVSVFSPGTLDLGTGKGHEFCAPSKEAAAVV